MTTEHQTATMVYASADALREFAAQALMRLDVPEEDARIAADILLESDLRGIDSHGITRFEQFYVTGIQEGRISPRPTIQTMSEAAATALVDGGGGLGMVVGYRAMQIAIDKAETAGAGFVTVCNSRHFGIAGYYATMALDRNMIGLAMTNSGPSVVPTFGNEARLGTNPIALAAPVGRGTPFVLDMATSTVAAGKFEVAARKGLPVPPGWAGDEQGTPTTDPRLARNGRHYSPLGGSPEMSSYKGYGLGVMVDILCGVLSGAGSSRQLQQRGFVGHFFGALNIETFRPLADFTAMMDDMHDDLRNTPPAAAGQRVLVPGDREFATKAERLAKGIPLYPDTVESLRRLSQSLGVPIEL
ncbi:MAG: Ldh family oxidoreductase [Chloroflexi bacterium]|nr:Ldh family oxidoreductase [Chloroflexota bacterium]